MICNGVVNNEPHVDHYDDRRPVTTEKKFSVLTQVETYAAHEQRGGGGGGGSREDIE